MLCQLPIHFIQFINLKTSLCYLPLSLLDLLIRLQKPKLLLLLCKSNVIFCHCRTVLYGYWIKDWYKWSGCPLWEWLRVPSWKPWWRRWPLESFTNKMPWTTRKTTIFSWWHSWFVHIDSKDNGFVFNIILTVHIDEVSV